MTTTSIQQLQRRLGALGQTGLPALMLKEAEKAALETVTTAKRLVVSRKQVGSGRLRDSIRAKVEVGGNGLVIRLSAGVSYGPIQEEGGTVTGKPWLKIPLRGASEGGKLFTVKLKDGRLFLARQSGSGLAFAYRLHPGPIRIKGGHFLRDALAEVQPKLKVALEKAVLAAIEGGGNAL